MKNSIGHTATHDCPRCAETVPASGGECRFCGHVLAPRKPLLTRVAEVASLAAVLAVIMIVCDLLGHLIDV